MQVWRKGAARTLKVIVGEIPDEKKVAAGDKGRKTPPKASEAATKLGMVLSELTADQRKELDVTGGLLVENATGNAAKAGIRRGDVLLAINNQDVKSLEQLGQVLGQYEKSRSVALLIRRGDSSIYIPLRLGAQ